MELVWPGQYPTLDSTVSDAISSSMILEIDSSLGSDQKKNILDSSLANGSKRSDGKSIYSQSHQQV